MRAVAAVAALTIVYALTLASVAPADLAAGVAVAVAVLLALRRFHRPPEQPARFRALHFPRFAAAVVRDITVGTWQVALVVLRLRPLERPGIVAVPLGDRTPSGVAVSALALTLSPGEVLVDVDWERRELLLHVLDARDPDAVRERHRRFYERYQRRVFP